MDSPLHVGLIGPGSIADTRLIPALAQLPNATFWSVLSRDRERADKFAQKHNAGALQAVHTNLDAFLADPQLDAVIIATPDRFHAEQSIAAAQAGKHIFVEKPMTTSLADAERVASACLAAKVTLAVGYHLRFHAGHQMIASLLDDGLLGPLHHMLVRWTMISPASDWRALEETSRWWSLAAVGTHALDMVRWLMLPKCGPIVELKSLFSNAKYHGPHDETAIVSLKFESGATAEVVSSVIFRAPRVMEIYGANGSILCSETLGPYGKGSITVNNKQLEYTPSDPYEGELANFINAVQTGEAPLSGLNEGRDNVSLLEDITKKWAQ